MHCSIMDDDVFPAAEKILSDIDAIFRKDPKLQNFEILPNEVSRNKSPVLHAEHTLGLEKWCIRHVYCHVYHRIIYLRQHQCFRREDPEVLARLLLSAVLLNPNVTLLWNMRRELVVQGRQDPIFELHLAAIALSRQPKTSEPFIYRRWLLERVLAKPIEKEDVSQILREELRVAQMAADRYPNNYHAWNHRMWTMSTVTPKTGCASEVYLMEWSASEAWISQHISEYSGMQYRQTLLNMLADSGNSTDQLASLLRQAMRKFFNTSNGWCCSSENGSMEKSGVSTLENILCDSPVDGETAQFVSGLEWNPDILRLGLLAYEMILNTELILLYPGHEALWSHRRFILHSLRCLAKNIDLHFNEFPKDYSGIPVTKAQKLCENSKNNFEFGPVWTSTVSHEEQLMGKCSSGTEDYQRKLCNKHKRWVNEILLR